MQWVAGIDTQPAYSELASQALAVRFRDAEIRVCGLEHLRANEARRRLIAGPGGSEATRGGVRLRGASGQSRPEEERRGTHRDGRVGRAPRSRSMIVCAGPLAKSRARTFYARATVGFYGRALDGAFSYAPWGRPRGASTRADRRAGTIARHRTFYILTVRPCEGPWLWVGRLGGGRMGIGDAKRRSRSVRLRVRRTVRDTTIPRPWVTL
jgi:hypothetical protein